MAVIASNLIGVISTGDEEDVLFLSPPLMTSLFVPVVSDPTHEGRMFAGNC